MLRQTRLSLGPLIGFAALAAAALACSLPFQQTGPEQTKTESVDLGAAESVDVELVIGAGELIVSGGATDLMEAEFTYNIERWEPEVEYTVSGNTGSLTVRQPEGEGVRIPDSDVRYEWDLQFNDETPLTMDINMGAGKGTLDLSSLTIGDLVMRTGAGEVNAVLGGSQLTHADINSGIGQTTIDLGGGWGSDASIVIKAGVGDMTVIVPSDVGAIVDVAVGIGNVNADGFRIQGDSYTNDAYGESDVTVRVEIDGGVGQITLEVE